MYPWLLSALRKNQLPANPEWAIRALSMASGRTGGFQWFDRLQQKQRNLLPMLGLAVVTFRPAVDRDGRPPNLNHLGMPDLERPAAGHVNPKRPKRLGRDEINHRAGSHHLLVSLQVAAFGLNTKAAWD